MGMQDLISNKQPNNDDLIRGHRAKLNIIYDDLIDYKEIKIGEFYPKEQFENLKNVVDKISTDKLVEKYYTDLGISSSYASSIIEYVKEYPLMLVPYGTGLSYYSLLREEAEDSLGSSFNAKDFNTVLLNDGDRNFDLVSSEVESYITGKNGTVASDSPVSSAETSSETSTNKEQPNWILFGAIGGGLAAVGIIALIAGRKYRKDDPFGA